MPNQQALKSENFVKKIKFLFFLVAFDAIEDCTIYRCSLSLSLSDCVSKLSLLCY